ncbi:MAG: FadR/GntR family transcriptional regulator [Bacillota bacterium]
MQFKPIKPRKIYEQIVEQIKSMITEGNLHPGDRLPSEREMADRLQVSRASVREALSALHLMGLVEIKSGEGTFIRQTNVDSLIEPLALILLMERDTVIEILEVRKGLEVEAAGIAALRRDDEDLQRIKDALDEMRQDIENSEVGEKADWKFHYAIAVASQNVLLARLMNTVSDTIENTMRTSRQKLYNTPNMPQTLLAAHEGIYEAICARDSMEARKRMYEHLAMVESHMVAD